ALDPFPSQAAPARAAPEESEPAQFVRNRAGAGGEPRRSRAAAWRSVAFARSSPRTRRSANAARRKTESAAARDRRVRLDLKRQVVPAERAGGSRRFFDGRSRRYDGPP